MKDSEGDDGQVKYQDFPWCHSYSWHLERAVDATFWCLYMLARAEQGKADENSLAETKHICHIFLALLLEANVFVGRTM